MIKRKFFSVFMIAALMAFSACNKDDAAEEGANAAKADCACYQTAINAYNAKKPSITEDEFDVIDDALDVCFEGVKLKYKKWIDGDDEKFWDAYDNEMNKCDAEGKWDVIWHDFKHGE